MTNPKFQIISKLQYQMIKTTSLGILNLAHSCLPAGRGIYLLFGLPARSPASRSLAEGRRSGEGRCLGFGAYLNYTLKIVSSYIPK
jgi:hypothetical protein